VKCVICGRETFEKYCVHHGDAYRNVVEKFEEWKRAMGVLWKQYLKAVVENAYTGSWAKEVAEQLLQNKDDKLCRIGSVNECRPLLFHYKNSTPE
jgi:hypothetical protein